MAEPFSEEFDNLLNKPLETITPNYRADAQEQALQLRNARPSLKQFLPQYLAGDVLGAGNYLGGGISDALSFGANLINQPKIGSKLAEFADQNYAQGSRFLKEGMFGGLGSVPEALFTGDTVPTPGEMQDTNFLQNPVITKIMNEAGEEAFDDLLKNSAPKTFDAFTEESVMGMAPPVGDPAKARALKEAETKKAIDDEAALNKREKALGDTKIDSAPSSTEDLFSSAMQDVIASVRGTGPDTPEQKTIDDYKKEFSEATGIDVSGKVDKSAALMAMGLSLMQNKAGKGFNVGKMLSAVGEAGEKALPALTAAKKEAKVSAAQAGKYAIEMRSADEAKRTVAKEKMMARENYYLVPKGEGISGQVDNILAGKGSLENLNKYELSKLMENPKFSSKFDILPGSSWEKIVQEVMKTPEAAELYDTKTPRKIELLGEGASDMFTIETWRALPNSGVESKLVGTGQSTYEGLSRAARDIALAKEKFATGLGLTKNVSVFNFTLDKIDSLASSFGVNVKSGTNDTEKLKLFLTKLQAQNAKEILGEAGKTISDADRALVKSIVGDVTLFSNTDLLQQKVSELFTEIVVKKERQILDGLRTLDRFSGRNVSSRLDSGTLSEEEQAELEKYLASPEFSQGKK